MLQVLRHQRIHISGVTELYPGPDEFKSHNYAIFKFYFSMPYNLFVLLSNSGCPTKILYASLVCPLRLIIFPYLTLLQLVTSIFGRLSNSTRTYRHQIVHFCNTVILSRHPLTSIIATQPGRCCTHLGCRIVASVLCAKIYSERVGSCGKYRTWISGIISSNLSRRTHYLSEVPRGSPESF